MISIVKIGGSLFDLPDLASRIRYLMKERAPGRVILFPGGGATADVVRDFDRRFRLGEEASHWLALRTLDLNARFLNALLPELPVISWQECTENPRDAILEPLSFARADEANPDHLPHTWQVTSDSLALRAAHLLHANLILAKSVSLAAGMGWEDAAALGLVDRFFPQMMIRSTGTEVSVVNLRR